MLSEILQKFKKKIKDFQKNIKSRIDEFAALDLHQPHIKEGEKGE